MGLTEHTTETRLLNQRRRVRFRNVEVQVAGQQRGNLPRISRSIVQDLFKLGQPEVVIPAGA